MSIWTAACAEYLTAMGVAAEGGRVTWQHFCDHCDGGELIFRCPNGAEWEIRVQEGAIEDAWRCGQDDDDCGDEPCDGFVHDGEADADALASMGWGTDEDYGYYGEE
jgi:hypothetical protein